MPQKDTLFEWRTIYKNVTLGLEINHLKDKEHLENVDNMLKSMAYTSLQCPSF